MQLGSERGGRGVSLLEKEMAVSKRKRRMNLME